MAAKPLPRCARCGDEHGVNAGTDICMKCRAICPECGGKKDPRSRRCATCRPKRQGMKSVHGMIECYSAGCRCSECKRANNERAALRKLAMPDVVREQGYRSFLKHKDARNARRRRSNSQKKFAAAGTVRRRLRRAGVCLDYVTDIETSERSRFLVYVLVDPRTIANRYVGVSSSGLERPRQHGTPSALAMNYNKRKDDWISKLKTEGLSYAIRVLQYCDTPEEAYVAERYWIHYLESLGEHLYNIVKSDGVYMKVSEETKEKMRIAMTGRVITWGDKISATKRGVLTPLSRKTLRFLRALLNTTWASIKVLGEDKRATLGWLLERKLVERELHNTGIRNLWHYRITELGVEEARKLQQRR